MAPSVDFEGLATAAGYKGAETIEDLEDFRIRLPELLQSEGPFMVVLKTSEADKTPMTAPGGKPLWQQAAIASRTPAPRRQGLEGSFTMPGVTLFERLGARGRLFRHADRRLLCRAWRQTQICGRCTPRIWRPGRARLKLFFNQWFGGPATYSEKYGHPRLRRRHVTHSSSTNEAAGRWLKHMREALAAAGTHAMRN